MILASSRIPQEGLETYKLISLTVMKFYERCPFIELTRRRLWAGGPGLYLGGEPCIPDDPRSPNCHLGAGTKIPATQGKWKPFGVTFHATRAVNVTVSTKMKDEGASTDNCRHEPPHSTHHDKHACDVDVDAVQTSAMLSILDCEASSTC